MPGMSLIYDRQQGIPPQREALIKALDETIFDAAYHRALHWETPHVLMGSVQYDAYPSLLFEDERFQIMVEGQVYNRTEAALRSELPPLLLHLADGGTPQKLTDWLLALDADMIVCAYDRANDTIIAFNDSLGRLPLYYWTHSSRIVIGRDLRLMTNMMQAAGETVPFDPYAMAEYMIFGYSLGGKMLIKGPRRIHPGTLLKIKDGRLSVEVHHAWNFDEKIHRHRSKSDNIKAMVPLFYDATIRRYDPKHANVISMSGGFDSRMVGAALVNNDLKTTSATFLDHQRGARLDADIAKTLSDMLGIPWELIQLPPITGEQIAHLVRIKNGLCSADLAVILPFFQALREHYGQDLIYWTGDGGDRTLKDLRAQQNVRSSDELLGFTLARNHQFRPDVAATLVGLKPKDLQESIRAHLLSYPEKNWRQKYTHFWMYERAFNWLFENEDRNRLYFWSTTPYYGIEYYLYSMNVNDSQKAFRILHRDIIKAMNPPLADVPDENIGLPPTSLKYVIKFALKQRMIGLFSRSQALARFGKRISRRTSAYPDEHPIFKAVHDQMTHSAAVRETLNANFALDYISDTKQTTRAQMRLLLSVAAAIEEFNSPEKTLLKYSDVELL